MRHVANYLGHHRFIGFSASLVIGLSLALTVGAVASVRHEHSGGGSVRSLARSETALLARPDRQAMSVFSRATTPGDIVPSSVRETLAQFAAAPVAAAENPGVAVDINARRAIVAAGDADASLYLVPTSKGSLCMLWTPDVYGGGCTAGFAPGAHAVYLRGEANGQSYVWGIVRNDVSSVAAVVGGNIVPTTNGQSAFFYQGAALPTSLQLTLHDGSVATVPVAALPTLH